LTNIYTENNLEKAVLVGVTRKSETTDHTKEHLDELSQLAATAGAVEMKRFTQKLDHPNPRTFIGPGKLEEIRLYVIENKIDLAIFDDELSPGQLRNLEKTLNIKILDRNNLILDIFATRAQTAQAKTQVELAQMEYMLPRLTRMWTHLERQKGGIGLRGPGETQIETDRRIIRYKISLLKEKLKKIEKQTETRKKRREEKIRVSLVGYTNAGKSTLMNLITKAGVLAENKLFATLDTTIKEVVLDNVSFLLSDTVGFIRKLPHSLVESFKSTLDEVREADILVHVVDISHPQFEEQIKAVNQTLQDIGAGGKPVLMVFNKIDALENFFSEENGEEMSRIDLLKNSWLNTGDKSNESIFISAEKRENIHEFRDKLVQMVKSEYERVYPYIPKMAGN
jgi:GTPase